MIVKRVVGACIFLICLASFLSAEKTAQISLRYSRQDTLVRLVIEGEDSVIAGSTTIASPTVLRIDFPALFDLKKPQDFPFEIFRKDRTLNIMLKDASDIKVYKLSNPSRIVADMKVRLTAGTQQPDQATVPPPRPLAQIAVPPVKQQPAAPQSAPFQPAAPQTAAPSPGTPAVFRTILIDPGHGGYDFGMVTQDFKEKDFTLGMARDLGAALAKKGLKVILTRRTDQSLTLSERVSFANSKTPDLFLSIHATPDNLPAVTTALIDDQGTDVVMKLYKIAVRQNRHIDRSRTAARSIAEALTADRRSKAVLRELPAPVLNSLDAPAVLIEYPVTAKMSVDQKARDKFISAIVKGLVP
ncbi:MAG TPA: N-acetylmuramoyl-L-alanine amidase [Thermodesulfovibrionales bacterium]|nr:N-acetylmuramoyl-L-alanine amidase [Thermodesulfovibrionales bacterium]